MKAIEIKELSKTFKGKKGRQVEALKSLSLSINHGEIFGFLGPNGAGKSTTIKILMGLITATSGSAYLCGDDVHLPQARRKVGYLPENPSFYDFLNAEEYLAFVGRCFKMPVAAIETESKRILSLLDLWEARKRPVRSYSKGMVQRLGLAQVLLHDPEIYILDEPMSGLDPVGRLLVKELILDLKKRGKCVFFSTHIISDVESVCDRVGIINHGVLEGLEDVQQLLRKGVVGFKVRIERDGESRDEIVGRDELSGFLRKVQLEGGEITLVEPQTRRLEDFFMDIVIKEKQ